MPSISAAVIGDSKDVVTEEFSHRDAVDRVDFMLIRDQLASGAGPDHYRCHHEAGTRRKVIETPEHGVFIKR